MENSSKRRRQSSEDENSAHHDEKLEINDNPDESGGEGDREEDLTSIVEF